MSAFWCGFEKAAAEKDKGPSLGRHVAENVLHGSALGMGVGQILGLATAKALYGGMPDSGMADFVGTMAGTVLGLPAGAAVGTASGLLNSKAREIRSQRGDKNPGPVASGIGGAAAGGIAGAALGATVGIVQGHARDTERARRVGALLGALLGGAAGAASANGKDKK